MAIYVNDSGTLRQISFLAINDSGTLRRINEVYVNDGGSLEGPFKITHQTSRNTATSTSTPTAPPLLPPPTSTSTAIFTDSPLLLPSPCHGRDSQAQAGRLQKHQVDSNHQVRITLVML